MKLINTALIAIQCIILIVICVMYLLMQQNQVQAGISWNTNIVSADSILLNSPGEAAFNHK